jgi:hypothetical protein
MFAAYPPSSLTQRVRVKLDEIDTMEAIGTKPADVSRGLLECTGLNASSEN